MKRKQREKSEVKENTHLTHAVYLWNNLLNNERDDESIQINLNFIDRKVRLRNEMNVAPKKI